MDRGAYTWKSLVKAGKGWSQIWNSDLATLASSLKVVKPHGDFPNDVGFISGITMWSNQSKITHQVITQVIR